MNLQDRSESFGFRVVRVWGRIEFGEAIDFGLVGDGLPE